MKYPKHPTQPYPPSKPNEPPKQYLANNIIGSLTIESHTTYSLQELTNKLQEATPPGKDLKELQIEFNGGSSYEYNDYTSNDISVRLISQTLRDMPRYKTDYRLYLKRVQKYELDFKEYEAKLEQFKKDLITYQKELDKYILETSRKEVKRLEKKLKVQKQ